MDRADRVSASSGLLGDADFLPLPNDPYKAHARAANKPEETPHFLLATGDYEGFVWSSYIRIARRISIIIQAEARP